jgi:hypothetical protein
MPDSETFDAFYARTVGRITSQMHELAANDGLADHAIREAYAKAYQQWYEVSGYRDPEDWVLSTAQEAYERRRAEAGFDRHAAAAQAADSGTWPGIYRPRASAGDRAAADLGQPAIDPDATMARPRRHAARRPAVTLATGAAAAAVPDYPAASDPAANYPATGPMAGGRASLSQPGSRKTLLIAGSVVAALVIASIAYVVSNGHGSTPRASSGSSKSVVTKPKVQMLPAGQTGPLSAVPWLLVGTGWALAEFSTAQPDSAGTASGAGRYTTYLVDTEGGKYTIATSSGGTEPQLMAWSGNAATALFDIPAAAGGTSSYQLLDVRTGQLTPLLLPAGVVALGFTRPDGTAILAVSQGPAKFHLERYTLGGQLQASIASLPRKAGQTLGPNDCATACALSSPDGLRDVWGIAGEGAQVLGNAGGKARRVHVQGSGHPSACMPLTWWNDTTVLASCAASVGSSRLWLVPVAGGSPTPLTAPAGSPSGGGDIEGAWQAGNAVYVTESSFRQCQGASSGPGGMDIVPLGQGASAAVTIAGSTQNFSTIVAAQGKRLLVLAQTDCPGTSSLLWLNPSTGTKQIAVTAPSTEVGVIAAVPFGNGPTAVAGGGN